MIKIFWLLIIIFIVLGIFSFLQLKPQELTCSKLFYSLCLVVGASSIIALVLFPFRETKVISNDFFAGVVSATLAGGLIGLVLMLINKVW